MKTAVYSILSLLVISTSAFADQCGSGSDDSASSDQVKIEKQDGEAKDLLTEKK